MDAIFETKFSLYEFVWNKVPLRLTMITNFDGQKKHIIVWKVKICFLKVQKNSDNDYDHKKKF